MRALGGICAFLALALAVFVIDRANAPRFALVSYYASGATLESETLDSGLSVEDCAFALEQGRLFEARAELLLTCEREQ